MLRKTSSKVTRFAARFSETNMQFYSKSNLKKPNVGEKLRLLNYDFVCIFCTTFEPFLCVYRFKKLTKGRSQYPVSVFENITEVSG